MLAVAAKEALERCTNRKEKLGVWLTVMKTMESIVTVLKAQPVRSNLICFVKVSEKPYFLNYMYLSPSTPYPLQGAALVLRSFLTSGITVCSELFRVEPTLVSQMLKTLQVSTRYLQKIFDNTKVSTISCPPPRLRNHFHTLIGISFFAG